MEQQLHNIKITDFAAKGKAIAKVDGRVIFVRDAVPGDIVNLHIFKKKRKYFEAEITEIIEASPYRTSPFCKHFGVCGGCKWQNLSYEKQLFYKQQEVSDQITRIGKQSNFEILPIVPSPQQQSYRNKLEYTFSNKAWVTSKEQFKNEGTEENALGFHVPGRFDKVLAIESCYLQDPLQNEIRNFLFAYAQQQNIPFYDLKNHSGYLRNLIFKSSSTGQWMLILIVAQDQPALLSSILNALAAKFPQITSLYYAINTKLNDSSHDLEMILFQGETHIVEQLKHYKYLVSPQSFFQVNVAQTPNLYDTIIEFANFNKQDTVYDLYCGTGSISIYMSGHVKQVIGIEYVQEAIDDAFKNNQLNNISNVHYVAGDMHKVLTQSFIDSHGKPSVIVTDPPRSGMHPKVIDAILYAAPEKIVYVSCNASTQARDIELLSSHYQLTKIKPVDMFPHTHHVENVAVLIKKN